MSTVKLLFIRAFISPPTEKSDGFQREHRMREKKKGGGGGVNSSMYKSATCQSPSLCSGSLCWSRSCSAAAACGLVWVEDFPCTAGEKVAESRLGLNRIMVSLSQCQAKDLLKEKNLQRFILE